MLRGPAASRATASGSHGGCSLIAQVWVPLRSSVRVAGNHGAESLRAPRPSVVAGHAGLVTERRCE